MNAVLNLILIISILTFGTVFALQHRYTVIQDPKQGTMLIDNWKPQDFNVLQCRSNGIWESMSINTGKIEIQVMETSTISTDGTTETTPPVI
jgi:hypothetical protein